LTQVLLVIYFEIKLN